MPDVRASLAESIRAGDDTVGTFVGLASPLAVEVCAASGLDWVLLDLEHGSGSEEQLNGTVVSARAYGVSTLVRVETAARIRIGRALDSGAAGVMLPRISGAEEAAEAIRHLRYPPAGDRGVANYNRAGRFGLAPVDTAQANSSVLGIVQIESASALAEVEQIAALDGVDVLFVGPMDLSHDLGVPGQFEAPVYLAALDAVVAAAQRHAKTAGILAGSADAANNYRSLGFRFIAIGSDSTILARALTTMVDELRVTSNQPSGSDRKEHP